MSKLDIPESWAEVDFGSLFDFQTGYAFKSSEYKRDGIFVLRVTNIDSDTGAISTQSAKYISQSDFEKKYQKFQLSVNDVLIVMVGASTGKIGLISDDVLPAVLNQNMWNINTKSQKLSKGFLFHYLNHIRTDVLGGAGGSARGFIKQSDFKVRKYPLAPEKEQKRIVQKIETCFEKVKSTEQSLTEVESLLEKYRESLLAKAFRGELVAQDTTDEPASVLLEKIRGEREKNQKGKKKSQEFAPISDDEKPFQIPDSWEWVRLGMVAEKIQYGFTASASSKGNVQFLRITDIQNDTVDWTQVPYCRVPENKICELLLSDGDILIARTGGTIGKNFLIRNCSAKSVFASYLIRIQPNSKVLHSQFLSSFLKSPFYWSFVTDNQRGAAQPNINGTVLSNMPLPMPPLDEQKRISSELEKIISFCDDFTKKISLKRNILSLSKSAILKKAFSGQLLEQVESEGTGYDLLKKIGKG